MASETLEIAAAKLAERLRSSPADEVVERLAERTARLRELREQAAARWESSRTAIEGLIGDVGRQRTRILDACLAFLEGIGALQPSLDTMATEASGAGQAAANALREALAPLEQVQSRLEGEVERWAPESGEFIVGLVEERTRTLTGGQAALAKIIGNDLRLELEARPGQFKQWSGKSVEISTTAIEALNASYEEWAVRLAQVAELARCDGRDRFAEHGASASKAAVEAAPAAEKDTVASARATLESAAMSLASLDKATQELPTRLGEALEATFAASDEVGQAVADASQALADWTGRLQLFAPEGA
jgi:hypothetical protein